MSLLNSTSTIRKRAGKCRIIGVKFQTSVRGLIEGNETEVYALGLTDTWLSVLNHVGINFDSRFHILKEKNNIIDAFSPIELFYRMHNTGSPYYTVKISVDQTPGYPPEKRKLIARIFGSSANQIKR